MQQLVQSFIMESPVDWAYRSDVKKYGVCVEAQLLKCCRNRPIQIKEKQKLAIVSIAAK